jgi:hypothetical protein
MNYVWKKAVITFYREKYPRESEPFAVIKSAKLIISKTNKNKLIGEIKDFFPLMGNLDCISSIEGITEKYVLCWFDDSIDDFKFSFRRISGVSFTDPVSYVLDENGKKTYSANFVGTTGKLE